MPVWNREKLVKESIESVLSQTYKDFELIIVNDGSTDKTKQVIRGYKDKRIRLIEKEHSGATETYNRGLKEAKGEFICILGSDDLWMPEKLEKQMQMAKKYPNYVLHTNAIEINEVNDEFYKSNIIDFSLEGYKERAMQPHAFFYGSSLWIPKKILDKVGLFPENINQDYYWVIKAILLYNVKFKLVSEYLVKKRQNLKSTSGENKKFILEEAERIRKLVMEMMK